MEKKSGKSIKSEILIIYIFELLASLLLLVLEANLIYLRANKTTSIITTKKIFFDVKKLFSAFFFSIKYEFVLFKFELFTKLKENKKNE